VASGINGMRGGNNGWPMAGVVMAKQWRTGVSGVA